MVDRPAPIDPAAVADVLAGYGIGPGAIVAPAQAADDAGDVLKGYGVVLKGGVAEPAKSGARQPASSDYRTTGDISKTKPGKIPEPPEPPPTSRELQAGEKRGLPAQFVSSIPVVGPLMDLATASARKPGDADNFGQRFYDQKQADRAFAMAHPILSTGAGLAGGAIGYGGLAKTAPALMGLPSRLLGSSLGARIYGGATGGAAVNALDAGLRGDNPLTAAEIGAAGGVAGPLLSEGARAVTATGANYFYPRPGPLKDIPRAGINMLGNALQGETPQSIAAAKARMGPAGMLSDLNPAMTDIAGAISDQSIPEKAVIQQAYRDRAAGQRGRIEDALTTATGIRPDVNIVDYKNFLTEARKAAADPLYEKFRDTKVYPTPELKALIPRLDKAGAFNMAEELSGISGEPINRNFFTGGPQKEYPTAQTWDYVKRGLDRRIDQAYAGGDKSLARELLKLKGEMLGEIEKTSAGSVWKQARSEFADRSALIDQVESGRDTFLGGRSGISVDELKAELEHLSGPELLARVTGMRKAVAEAMGDKTEGAGLMRSKLLAPNNQEKMRLMLNHNPGAADKLISTLESEKYLADKNPAILPNMNTGASGQTRAERRKLFEPPELPSWLENVNLVQPGSWIPPRMRPHNVLQTIMNERASRSAPALTPIMLTPRGQDMNELIASVFSEQNRLAKVDRIASPLINNLIGAPIAGPGQATYRRSLDRQ